MSLICVSILEPNERGQCHFSGTERKIWAVMKFVWRKESTCKKVSAPIKWPWPRPFGLKIDTHISHIYLRLTVEAFSSNRLDCRENCGFANIYKFPFSCFSKIFSILKKSSVVIWSRGYCRSGATSYCVRVLVKFHSHIDGLFNSTRYEYKIFW